MSLPCKNKYTINDIKSIDHDIGNIIALSGRNSLSKVKRNIHETSIVYREFLWHVEIIADDIHH